MFFRLFFVIQQLCVLLQGTCSSQLVLLGITFTYIAIHKEKKVHGFTQKNVPSVLLKRSIMYRLCALDSGLCVLKTDDRGSFRNSSHIKITQDDQTCPRFAKSASIQHLTLFTKVKAFYHLTTFLACTIYTLKSVHSVYH